MLTTILKYHEEPCSDVKKKVLYLQLRKLHQKVLDCSHTDHPNTPETIVTSDGLALNKNTQTKLQYIMQEIGEFLFQFKATKTILSKNESMKELVKS